MDNSEEILQILERFTRLKQKDIPKELDDYLRYVAKSGDTVFKWTNLKYFIREKLFNVIKIFHDTTARVDDLPQYPNVDPFNYESMKSGLIERLELFNAAPFTIQRLCELLSDPRKQYSRIDKFMRALEKNILVSTIDPGRKRVESENGDSLDSIVNGDISLDVNVDIDIETAQSQTQLSSSSLIDKVNDDVLPNPKKPKLDIPDSVLTEAIGKGSLNASKSSSKCSKDVEILSSTGSNKSELNVLADSVITQSSLGSTREVRDTTIHIKKSHEKKYSTSDIKSTELTAECSTDNAIGNIAQSNASNELSRKECTVDVIETEDRNIAPNHDIEKCTTKVSPELAFEKHRNDIGVPGVENVRDNSKYEYDVKATLLGKGMLPTLYGMAEEKADKELRLSSAPLIPLLSEDDYSKENNQSDSNIEGSGKTSKDSIDIEKSTYSKETGNLTSPAAAIDQPMEENSDATGSNVEVESISNSIVQNLFNEEIMNDGVDMATDTIEIPKDEAAGMEIDDSSQEAMDQ